MEIVNDVAVTSSLRHLRVIEKFVNNSNKKIQKSSNIPILRDILSTFLNIFDYNCFKTDILDSTWSRRFGKSFFREYDTT